jgi:hypothetical protein
MEPELLVREDDLAAVWVKQHSTLAMIVKVKESKQ